MKNLDQSNQKQVDLQNSIKKAIESGDSDAFVKAQIELAKQVENRVLDEAKQARNENMNDQAVMIKRGLNPLTVEEKSFYDKVIKAGGFEGIEEFVPSTVFDRVFEDLKANHELLSEINFVNTTATTEWITRNNDAESAWWGALTSAITKKLETAFKKEKTELFKLSAFVPVAKAMLDLGPAWLDKFVREILVESMAIALELAIVAGTGKEQPIGMVKDLAGAVVEGVYPDKKPVELLNLKPATLGTKVMSPLTRNGKRTVDKVLMIVNPLDYWAKIFAATTFLTADKTYVYGVLPIPAKVIQSVAVPAGKMVAGMAKDYFMGVGSTQKIDYSDHYKFLEDERTYIAKQYANGKPMDNDSFIVFDISKMTADTPTV